MGFKLFRFFEFINFIEKFDVYCSISKKGIAQISFIRIVNQLLGLSPQNKAPPNLFHSFRFQFSQCNLFAFAIISLNKVLLKKKRIGKTIFYF